MQKPPLHYQTGCGMVSWRATIIFADLTPGMQFPLNQKPPAEEFRIAFQIASAKTLQKLLAS